MWATFQAKQYLPLGVQQSTTKMLQQQNSLNTPQLYLMLSISWRLVRSHVLLLLQGPGYGRTLHHTDTRASAGGPSRRASLDCLLGVSRCSLICFWSNNIVPSLVRKKTLKTFIPVLWFKYYLQSWPNSLGLVSIGKCRECFKIFVF